MLERNCPYGDESLVVADYLAGRLSRTEAEAFEAHSFGCERCFDELQRAGELRAAGDRVADAARVRPPGVRLHRPPWPLLGMAATIALAAGLWFAQPLLDDARTPTEPVYRDDPDDAGSEPVLELAVEGEGDSVSLSWRAIAGADAYQVRIFTEDGDPVFERQTMGTSMELAADAWRDAGASGTWYGQVVAVDELRQVIAQSGFEPL